MWTAYVKIIFNSGSSASTIQKVTALYHLLSHRLFVEHCTMTVSNWILKCRWRIKNTAGGVSYGHNKSCIWMKIVAVTAVANKQSVRKHLSLLPTPASKSETVTWDWTPVWSQPWCQIGPTYLAHEFSTFTKHQSIKREYQLQTIHIFSVGETFSATLAANYAIFIWFVSFDMLSKGRVNVSSRFSIFVVHFF